jgi:hypothetical protein
MKRIRELTKFIDQSIWVSDDRVSALISHRCQGIEQIDFHGAQPVSRNARMLYHSKGVLKIQVKGRFNGVIKTYPIQMKNLSYYPAGVIVSQNIDTMRVKLEFCLLSKTLSVRCSCLSYEFDYDWSEFQFQLLWNKNSQTTEVHGNRVWNDPEFWGDNYLILKCTDQIHLNEWLKRSGDYQGDFLIPEGWRRIIFKNQKISGQARLSDLNEKYLVTSLKLYDADTYIALGGMNYILNSETESSLKFTTSPVKINGQRWQSSVFSIQFSESKDKLKQNLFEHNSNIFQKQRRRYFQLQDQIPKLIIEGYPDISDFFSATPAIVESARVQDFGMTRACPGTYYWLWAWDNMVTALAQAHWGDLKNLYRMVDFLRIHRDIDGSIPGRWTRQLEAMDSRGIGGLDFLFSEVVMTLYRETEDEMVLRTNYPTLCHAFKHLFAKTNEQGLFPTIGMYPDLPEKMGRSPESFVAIDDGAWYGLCRNLEKIAYILDDIPMAESASIMAEKISKNFNNVFFDEEKGFICDSFNPKTKKAIPSYPLFSLLVLESPQGYPLIAANEKSYASFIAENLMSENGISLTPPWDMNHRTEPALSAWYPHWDIIATKILSLAGDTDSLNKWLSLVNNCYCSLGYCPEFVSIDVSADEKWKRHGAAWNLNCAAGWYQSLLFAVGGLDFSVDGITCHSTHGMPDFRLDSLYFKGGRWTFQKTGKGKFINELLIDGNIVKGTQKIPFYYYTKEKHQVTIQYCTEHTPYPKISRLNGAAVLDVSIKKTTTICRVKGFGLTDIMFSIPATKDVDLLLDGKNKQYSMDDKRENGYCQLKLSREHELILSGVPK